MRVLSVDPGISGALVVIEARIPVNFYSMPVRFEGSKSVVDLTKLATLVRDLNVDIAVVEKVGASPRMGTGSAFNFGNSYGRVEGVLAGVGITQYTITPQLWKTYHGLLRQPKDAARIKIIKMFPELAETFKLKKSVDKADAALLCLAWLIIEKK